MFKFLLGKILRTRTAQAQQSTIRAEAAVPVAPGRMPPVSIFEDETYKVGKAYRVPPMRQQPSFERSATFVSPQIRQVEVPLPLTPEPERYRTVPNQSVAHQEFVSLKNKARNPAGVAPDPRAAYLYRNANDIEAPGGYLPAYRLKILEVVDRHADTLVRKYKQLVAEDDYGTLDFAAWVKEADYFVDRVLRRELGSDLFGLPDGLATDIVTARIIAWDCAPDAVSTAVPDRPVAKQEFASVEDKVRELSDAAPDRRAAYLDRDANDIDAPGGYLPTYRLKILEVVDRHADTLVRKYKQLVVEDDYGNLDFAAWVKEADYFVDRVLRGELGSDLFGLPDGLATVIVTARIIAWDCAPAATSTAAAFSEQMSGHDYEHYCAELLRAAGWTARVTKASGDQGVDVEARKDDVRVVFQCKKYSTAVGNAAVQEVLAGKEFYGADVGAVVSNASFTNAAKQLARSTGILLLHHDDLSTFKA